MRCGRSKQSRFGNLAIRPLTVGRRDHPRITCLGFSEAWKQTSLLSLMGASLFRRKRVFGKALQRLGHRVFVSLLVSWSASVASAQNVKFDGSLGQPGSNGKNGVQLTGPNYGILIEDGKDVGTNVFHSFEYFDLTNGEIADFESTGMANILVRVTSASPVAGMAGKIDGSNIDGTLKAGANLFFMNPRGILFGPNAQLDLIAFTATTADQMNLSDSEVFAVSGSGDATLSSAPVAYFGFAGPTVEGISLEGTSLSNGNSATEVDSTISLINRKTEIG